MIYGELGAYPLYIDIHSRMISFWTKLGDYGPNEIATSLYRIIHNLNEKKQLKSNWLQHIKNIIVSNGFGGIWDSHNNVNKKWFVQSFKQKLKDQYIQNWNSLVDNSSSGKNYRIFKESFDINPYFLYLSNRNSRLLTAFRTRNHRLPIEIGRWTSIATNERLCWLCNAEIGDEFHYIMKCTFFNEQRNKYIKPYYTRNINVIKFGELMNHKNKTVVKNLCSFIEIIMDKFKNGQNVLD